MRNQLLCTAIAATAAAAVIRSAAPRARAVARCRGVRQKAALWKNETYVEPGLAHRRRRGHGHQQLLRGIGKRRRRRSGTRGDRVLARRRGVGSQPRHATGATRRRRHSTSAMRPWQHAPVCSSPPPFLAFSRRSGAVRARSTILVGLCPLWVGLVDRIRGEGVAAARFGSAAPARWPGRRVGRRHVRSHGGDRDALAAASGVLWAAYILAAAATRARARASTWRAGVCLAATCVLAPAALFAGATRCGDSADKPRCSSPDSLLYLAWSVTRCAPTWSNTSPRARSRR